MVLIVGSSRSVSLDGRLYVPGEKINLPDKEAKRLLDKGVCEICDEGIIAETPALEDMTIADLKKLLDKLYVVYDGKARKDSLISLVRANTAEPSTDTTIVL